MIAVIATNVEGDWFLIPKDRYNEFVRLCEKYDSIEEYTDESDAVADEIENTFGEYKTGGDLNLVQLYVE